MLSPEGEKNYQNHKAMGRVIQHNKLDIDRSNFIIEFTLLDHST